MAAHPDGGLDPVLDPRHIPRTTGQHERIHDRHRLERIAGIGHRQPRRERHPGLDVHGDKFTAVTPLAQVASLPYLTFVPRYSAVPESVVLDAGLSAGAKSLALAIGLHINGRSGDCWPSQDTLAEMMGVLRQGVTLATRDLEARGHITIERRHRKSSVYRWHDQPHLRTENRTQRVRKITPKQCTLNRTPTAHRLTAQEQWRPADANSPRSKDRSQLPQPIKDSPAIQAFLAEFRNGSPR